MTNNETASPLRGMQFSFASESVIIGIENGKVR